MNGWIKIPREIIHQPIFKNGDLVRLLVWLNAKAVYKAQTVAVGLQDVELAAGQMLYGVNKAVEELDIPKTTVRRYMKRLEQQGYISIRAGQKYSIVDLRRTSDGLQTDTYKKEKKEKKEKNNIDRAGKQQYAEFVWMTPEQYADLIAQYGDADTVAMIDLLNNHKGATGKEYEDDYYAAKGWCAKAVQAEKEKPAKTAGRKKNGFINYVDEHADFSDVERCILARRRAASAGRNQPSAPSLSEKSSSA